MFACNFYPGSMLQVATFLGNNCLCGYVCCLWKPHDNVLFLIVLFQFETLVILLFYYWLSSSRTFWFCLITTQKNQSSHNLHCHHIVDHMFCIRSHSLTSVMYYKLSKTCTLSEILSLRQAQYQHQVLNICQETFFLCQNPMTKVLGQEALSPQWLCALDFVKY